MGLSLRLKAPGSKQLVIYGANSNGRCLYEALSESSRVLFFIEDLGPETFLGLPVLEAADFLKTYDATQITVLIAKRDSHPDALAQGMDIIPFLLLRAAVQQLPQIPDALQIDPDTPIEINALRSSSGFMVPPSNALEAFFALLSCIRCPLDHWRLVLRNIFRAQIGNAVFWDFVGCLLRQLGYTKIRFLVFRVARRIAPQDLGVASELVKACDDFMAGQARDGALGVKWAKRTYRHGQILNMQWPCVYTLHKRQAVAAQEFMDMRSAIELIAEANRRRALQNPSLNYLHLAPSLFSRIGSTMHAECLIKTQKLGWSPATPLACVYGEGPMGNTHLVHHYLGRFIQFIPEAGSGPMTWPEREKNDAFFELAIVQQGETRFTPAATISARNEWLLRGNAPLLALTESDLIYGGDFLKNHGLEPKQPFVTLHCRHEHYSKTDFRNSSLERVIPTILWLRQQGFQVIRIGDKGMPPLPEMAGVLDLATQFAYDARLNVFFLGGCAFYVGSSSGPVTVPPCFGVSTVSIDTLPIGAACGSSCDTYLPNIIIDSRTKEAVPWAKAFSLEASIAHFDHHWQALNMTPIPNSAEEILETVKYHAHKCGLTATTTVAHLPSPSIEQKLCYASLMNFASSPVSEPIHAEMSSPFMARHARLLD